MRKIGRLDDAPSAQLLSDALLGRGIDSVVEEDDGAFAVWIRDDARVAEARDAFAAFRDHGPAAFEADAAAGRQRRQEVRRKDVAYQERLVLARQSIHGADGHGWLTLAIGAATVAIAAVGRFGANVDLLGPLFVSELPAGFWFPEVRGGQVWRLVTPILVHFGTMHLLFDLSAWASFARAVEVRKGFRFTALFVVTCAIVSNACEQAWAAWSRPMSTVLVGGLSGVIYGLAAYVFVKGRIDPLDRLGLDEGSTRLLVIWLLLGFTGVLGPIANVAHLTGLLWGALYAVLDVAWFHRRKRRT
jgi:GlpG protein